MRSLVVVLGVSVILCGGLAGQDCQSVALQLKLPVKVKTQGSPRIAKWGQVDDVMNGLAGLLQGKSCQFTFEQIFRMKEEEVLFPLTNSVIRIAPEEAFAGLAVTTREGHDLGVYEGRVLFEHSGGGYARDRYQLYHFQYKDAGGEMHAAGKQLLMDSFAIEWSALKGRVAISTQ